MIEIINKRNWDSKCFDTERVQQVDGQADLPIYGTTLQNGLHDIEPDGSFVECDMTIEAIVDGVTTHQIKRGRYGELRFGDNSSENQHLCKIKYKDGNGISLKYLGADSGSPIINGDVKFAAADGIQLRHVPTYEGVKIELITNDPLTASLEYVFSIKTYGQNYTYEIVSGSILATGEDGKIVTIHAPYAVDANDDTGQVHYELLGIVEGYQTFKKVVDETWLRQAAAPVKIDPDVTIENGVNGGVIKDNYTRTTNPTYNWGAAINMNIGFSTQRRAFIGVDLANYIGVTVTNAKFSIYSTSAANLTDLYWYRILRQWGEGNKNGAVATTGEMSYNDYAVPNAWTVAGCDGAGTDRSATSENASAGSWLGVGWNDFDCLPTSIEADLGGFFSIMIKDDVTASNKGLISSQGTSGLRPTFYMEYTEGLPGFPFFFGHI